MERHICSTDNAEKFLTWIRERGGLAIWRSVNFGNPGASWTTPVRSQTGCWIGKPNWQCSNEPERIITDPAEVVVVIPKELRRFHVAVERHGLKWTLTQGSSRRLRSALAKAGELAFYGLDHETQEAVIMVPDKEIPLLDFVENASKSVSSS